MPILTNIIAAEEDACEAIGESLDPIDEWSGVALRDLTIPRIATLHCILTGDLYDDACMFCEPVYVSDREGAVVLRLADSVITRLAELDEETLEVITMELVATEAFEDAGWSAEEVGEMIYGLADLARLAESQGQILFAWLHPLRT